MPKRIKMVGSVVAIIETVSIWRDVNERDAGSVIGVWVFVVDEGMLAPISDHEAEAEEKEGEDVDEESWAEIGASHEDEESVICCFPERAFEGECVLFLLEEVDG